MNFSMKIHEKINSNQRKSFESQRISLNFLRFLSLNEFVPKKKRKEIKKYKSNCEKKNKKKNIDLFKYLIMIEFQ